MRRRVDPVLWFPTAGSIRDRGYASGIRPTQTGSRHMVRWRFPDVVAIHGQAGRPGFLGHLPGSTRDSAHRRDEVTCGLLQRLGVRADTAPRSLATGPAIGSPDQRGRSRTRRRDCRWARAQQPAVPVIGVLSAQVFRGARVIVGDGRVIDDASSFGCWPSHDTVRISGRLRIINASR
jgi:hypothetical protein